MKTQTHLLLQLVYLKLFECLEMSNFNGRSLKVACPNTDASPNFSLQTTDSGTWRYAGVDLELLKYVAGVLNFTFTMVQSVDGHWGSVDENGTWNGMIGMVARKEVDIALGQITITAKRSEVVNFSYPYFDAGTCLMSHVPEQLPKWQAIAWPFKQEVWIAILLTFVAFSIIMTLLIRAAAPGSRFTFLDGFSLSLRSVLSQGTGEWPSRHAIKVAILFWISYCLVMDALYSSSLTSSLTRSREYLPLDTLEQLARSNLFQIRVPKGTSNELLFQQSNDTLYQRIVAKMDGQKERYADLIDGLRQLMNQSNLVMVEDCISGVRDKAFYYSLKSGETYVHVSRDQIPQSGYGLAISQGAPYLKDFNKLIKRVLYFGLIKKWTDDALYVGKVQVLAAEGNNNQQRMAVESYIRSLKDSSIDGEVLTTNNLQGAFYIFLFGIGVSGLFFVHELMLKHKMMKIHGK